MSFFPDAQTISPEREDPVTRTYTALVINSVSALALLMPQAALAEPAEPTPPSITVAVLGVETPSGEGDQIGRLIAEMVEVILSGEDRFELVNRSDLAATLEEQGINLAGVTDTTQATQIGRVVGAKLLVTGKAFELGESRVVTAKVIGSETTRIKAVMARGKLDDPLDALVFEVAQKLGDAIREHGSGLVASEEVHDPIPALIEQLKGKPLPVFAIVIPEEHRRRLQPIDPPDPAVETELKKLLIDAGVDVRDLKDNALADWVTQYEQGENPAWPRTLEGVDVVIVGEAFSESAGTMGSLRLASARAEINCIARENGRIIHADRVTTRGVDLAEEIAGKTALEKAGRVLAERLLAKLAKDAG